MTIGIVLDSSLNRDPIISLPPTSWNLSSFTTTSLLKLYLKPESVGSNGERARGDLWRMPKEGTFTTVAKHLDKYSNCHSSVDYGQRAGKRMRRDGYLRGLFLCWTTLTLWLSAVLQKNLQCFGPLHRCQIPIIIQDLNAPRQEMADGQLWWMSNIRNLNCEKRLN